MSNRVSGEAAVFAALGCIGAFSTAVCAAPMAKSGWSVALWSGALLTFSWSLRFVVPPRWSSDSIAVWSTIGFRRHRLPSEEATSLRPVKFLGFSGYVPSFDVGDGENRRTIDLWSGVSSNVATASRIRLQFEADRSASLA